MAEASFQILLDNLSSLIGKEIRLILGANKEMDKLRRTLTTIQAVLEDAEDKQFESKPIQNWLRKLNHLASEIDDMLDLCAIEVSKFKKKNNKFNMKKVLLQRKIGRRVKEMAEKLNDVAAERENFHLRESSVERQTEVAARRTQRETGSVLNDPNNVRGRDGEKEKLVDILVNHVGDCQQLSVLPIIGLGGLGKTTLAQLVYNDQRIKDHFDLKLWVCVSDAFDVKTTLKAVLESATRSGSASDLTHLDALQRRVSELLNKKRYLLILDDVWNEDQKKWDMLREVLACGSRGASIVVTTRLKKVAEIMGTVPAHCLKELSEEHCWLLFKQYAFGEKFEEFSNLEPIGRQIVRKCAGVPLAAKALGGLLRFKRKEKEWIDVKESELWDLGQETSILPSLRLSYRHLPLVLRRCFAYCALFPKDAVIRKKELIYHWMAHGCISSNGRKEVEDIGDEVWNELVLRSLLSIDEGETCRMHDLVHDLALSIMENQVPEAHANSSPTPSNDKIRQLHVSADPQGPFDEYPITVPTSIQLRVSTLISIVNFSRLRMLTISGRNIEVLPSSIGKLKQMRYLNLSESSIRTLPITICGLQKLQILNLNSCYKLVSLPNNMSCVDSLRHLFLEGCYSLIETPSGIGVLTSLKTLSVFIVGDKIGNQLGELEFLNLGGRLEIQHLERVKNQKDAEKANLREKSNLHSLLLRWEEERDASGSREMMDKMVLEALEPHSNIETLRIHGYKGRAFPVWMGNSTMNNVTEIHIDNCANCSHLPPLGDLPCLKMLLLVRIDTIEFITENGARGGIPFPSLEELDLQSLPNLKGLLKEDVTEMFPNLQKLAIANCSSLRLPPLSSLKVLLRNECRNSTQSLFSKSDNLTSLHLCLNMNSTACIPNEALESLSNLEKLMIWSGHERILPVEGLQCLKSLRHLKISMRRAVTCLPGEWFRHLVALEKLSISGTDLAELPDEIKDLHSLKTLELHSVPMVRLPDVIQHVHSLETLDLKSLHELTSLPDWLDKLMSLVTLCIQYCPRIVTLPSCMQGMANLQILTIIGCPQLERRCEKEKGEDWHKIAHIPNLCVDCL